MPDLERAATLTDPMARALEFVEKEGGKIVCDVLSHHVHWRTWGALVNHGLLDPKLIGHYCSCGCGYVVWHRYMAPAGHAALEAWREKHAKR